MLSNNQRPKCFVNGVRGVMIAESHVTCSSFESTSGGAKVMLRHGSKVFS